MKTSENRPQKLLLIGPNLFFLSPAQPTAQSPKLIIHCYKYVPRPICLLICDSMYNLRLSLYSVPCTWEPPELSTYRDIGLPNVDQLSFES